MDARSSCSAEFQPRTGPELVHEIQELMLEELSIRVPSADIDLVQKGILDSVTMVRLAAALEKRFHVRVPVEELVLDVPCSIENIAKLAAECTRAENGRRSLAGKVQALLAEKLSIRVESPETNLFETGALDSMTLVQLVLTLEESFGIELPVQELEPESFATAAKIAETIASRRRNGGA